MDNIITEALNEAEEAIKTNEELGESGEEEITIIEVPDAGRKEVVTEESDENVENEETQHDNQSAEIPEHQQSELFEKAVLQLIEKTKSGECANISYLKYLVDIVFFLSTTLATGGRVAEGPIFNWLVSHLDSLNGATGNPTNYAADGARAGTWQLLMRTLSTVPAFATLVMGSIKRGGHAATLKQHTIDQILLQIKALEDNLKNNDTAIPEVLKKTMQKLYREETSASEPTDVIDEEEEGEEEEADLEDGTENDQYSKALQNLSQEQLEKLLNKLFAAQSIENAKEKLTKLLDQINEMKTNNSEELLTMLRSSQLLSLGPVALAALLSHFAGDILHSPDVAGKYFRPWFCIITLFMMMVYQNEQFVYTNDKSYACLLPLLTQALSMSALLFVPLYFGEEWQVKSIGVGSLLQYALNWAGSELVLAALSKGKSLLPKFSASEMKGIAKLAFSMYGQMLTELGSVFLDSLLAYTFGQAMDNEAYLPGLSVLSALVCWTLAFGNFIRPVLGNKLGKKNFKAARRTVWAGNIAGTLTASGAFLLIFFLRNNIAKFFLPEGADQALLDEAALLISVIAGSNIIDFNRNLNTSISQSFGNVLYPIIATMGALGSGVAASTVLAAFAEQLGISVPLAIQLGQAFGFVAGDFCMRGSVIFQTMTDGSIQYALDPGYYCGFVPTCGKKQAEVNRATVVPEEENESEENESEENESEENDYLTFGRKNEAENEGGREMSDAYDSSAILEGEAGQGVDKSRESRKFVEKVCENQPEEIQSQQGVEPIAGIADDSSKQEPLSKKALNKIEQQLQELMHDIMEKLLPELTNRYQLGEPGTVTTHSQPKKQTLTIRIQDKEFRDRQQQMTAKGEMLTGLPKDQDKKRWHRSRENRMDENMNERTDTPPFYITQVDLTLEEAKKVLKQAQEQRVTIEEEKKVLKQAQERRATTEKGLALATDYMKKGLARWIKNGHFLFIEEVYQQQYLPILKNYNAAHPKQPKKNEFEKYFNKEGEFKRNNEGTVKKDKQHPVGRKKKKQKNRGHLNKNGLFWKRETDTNKTSTDSAKTKKGSRCRRLKYL